MSRTIIARGAALAAATMLALTACGGTDEATENPEDGAAGVEEQEAEQDVEAAEDADTEEAEEGAGEGDDATEDSEDATDEEADAEGGDAAAAGEPTVVEVGTEFTDEETGDVVTIVSAVRHNPTEYYMASDNPDGEMVYLEVKVVPGDQFGGTISVRDFFLLDGGEEVNYANVEDEVTAAGHEYFERAPRRDGEHTGYVPIYVETTADTLEGAYIRPEAKILGEDETIPEFRADFEIPAS